MRVSIITFFLFYACPLFPFEYDLYVLMGTVCDAINEKPLVGANVTTIRQKMGSATDSLGLFSIHLRVPTDTLHISYIGYRSFIIPISFHAGEFTKTVDCRLVPVALPGEEVSISANRETGYALQVSKQSLRMMTSPMPEALQALQTLPGVTSGNDQSSFYNVRGGNYNENLIYINGFEVQQLQSVRKGYMENPSFVNQNMVSKFDLLTGFRPVSCGDKLSSALDIDYSPSQGGLHVSTDIRTIGISGALSYKADDRFSVNLGVRKINYGYLMGANQLSGTYQPDFQDLQAAARWSLKRTLDIDLMILNTSSRFKLAPKHWEYKSYYMGDYEMVFNTGRQAYNFENRTIGARLSYMPIPRLRLTAQYSNQLQKENEISSLDFIVQQYVIINNEKEIINNASLLELADNVFSGRYHNLKTEVDVDLSGLSLRGGYEGNRYLADQKIAGFELVRYMFYEQTDDLNTANTFQSSTHAYYCQIEGTAFENLQYYFGIRKLLIPRSSEALVLPRFQLDFTIADGHHLTASMGRYAQPPFHKEFAKSRMKNVLRSQKASMATLGYESYLKKIVLKAEGYYKHLNDLVSYDIADVQIDYSGLNDSRGTVYGMDIYARFQQRDELTHWISYSYLVAREDLLGDGRGFLPMPTDRRHQFAVFTEDYMTKYPNSKMHMRIIYGSGFPYTDYRYQYDEESSELSIVKRPRNSSRLPLYARFDIGYTQEFTLFSRYKIVLREEILNLFNHYNVLSIGRTPWNMPVKFAMGGRIFNLGAMIEF